MVNWQILSQLQGPQIDVNLFPQAGLAGAQASRYNPGTLAAIGQGVTQGIGNFLDVYQGFQQIDLNSAKIDAAEAQAKILQHGAEPEQLETTDQLARARAQEAAARARTADIGVESYETNKDRIQTARDTALQAQEQQNLYKTDVFRDINDFKKLRDDPNATALDIESMLQSGNTAMQNPNNRLALLQRYIKMPEVMGDPDKFDEIAAEIKYTDAQVGLTAEHRKSGAAYQKEIDDADVGEYQPSAYGRTKDQFLRDVQIQPTGTYKATNGYYDESAPGIFVPTGEPAVKSTDRTFDVLLQDSTGRYKVIRQIAPDQEKELSKLKDRRLSLDGAPLTEWLNNLRAQVQRNKDKRNGTGPAAVADKQLYLGKRSLAEAQADTSTVISSPKDIRMNIINKFNLDKPTQVKTGWAFEQLERYASDYANNLAVRRSGRTVPAEAGIAITRAIAEKEYNERPAVRKQMDEALAVYNKNKQIEDEIRVRNEQWPISTYTPEVYVPPMTAFELYYSKRKAALLFDLDAAVTEYYESKGYINRSKILESTADNRVLSMSQFETPKQNITNADRRVSQMATQ